MSTPTPREDVPIRRIDRILAFMSLGLIVLSIVSFFVILIGSATHATYGPALSAILRLVCYVAPVIAFILLMVVLISSFVRRARANRAR